MWGPPDSVAIKHAKYILFYYPFLFNGNLTLGEAGGGRAIILHQVTLLQPSFYIGVSEEGKKLLGKNTG